MQLTRRFFLRASGALVAYLGVTPFDVLAEEAPGSTPAPVTRGKTLVLVFLRGGTDGLNLVVPFSDPAYYKLRQSIAIPVPGAPGGAIDLDGAFGLHPKLKALVPSFASGQAVAVHAVGHDQNTRSHFEEQDVWETGIIGNSIHSDGWVNRHLLTSTGHGPIRAVAVGDTLPRILHGKAAAYAISGVDDLTLPDGPTDRATLAAALEHAYKADPKAESGPARDLLAQTGAATLAGIDQLRGLVGQPYVPAVKYPETDLARRLREVARLVKGDVGLEVAELDYGGWDTHQNEGNADGPMGNLAQELADALAAFLGDLCDRMDDVLVLTLSDFGRTAAENGTRGTDHGWANCLFAFGGPVKKAAQGRKVLGTWPGLAPEMLHEGRDLQHTTDFRDAIAEAVRVHLGNPNLEKVLPGWTFKPVGIAAS